MDLKQVAEHTAQRLYDAMLDPNLPVELKPEEVFYEAGRALVRKAREHDAMLRIDSMGLADMLGMLKAGMEVESDVKPAAR